MITLEGSYVGTLQDLRELLALVQAGKVPPIPLETRAAAEASAALSDSKSGGRCGGGWYCTTINWKPIRMRGSRGNALAVLGFGRPGFRHMARLSQIVGCHDL
jgi:hypothetical protein